MSYQTAIQTQKQSATATPISSVLQRQCACGQHTVAGGECAECRQKRLQRKAVGHANPETAPPIVHEVLRSPGRPLDTETRAFMEPRFGHDFSQVRVHTDAKAAQSAQAVNALAYTVGRNVVFGAGQYAPGTSEGWRLLAHELTHVVQQRAYSGATSEAVTLPPASDNARLEYESERASNTVVAGRAATFPLTQSGSKILRRNGSASGSGSTGIRYPRQTHAPGGLDLCADKRNITQTFRDFVAAVPTHIASIPNLQTEEQTRLTALATIVLHSEGTADIDNFSIVACSTINTPLTLPGEEAQAYVDVDNQEVGLLQNYVDQMNGFSRNPTLEGLLPILTVIAHEKRHVTLGSAVNVDPANLRPQLSPSQAGKAAYRVEEILAVAEEIAVERRYTGESYAVPVTRQTQLTRLWNTIKAWVTEAEAQRLRDVIIQQLRRRYGTEPNCDNSVTLGVVEAMETGRWYLCDRGTGRVVGAIPRGLNLCERNGRHRVCGPAPSTTTSTGAGGE
jgi:hypothetical protein